MAYLPHSDADRRAMLDVIGLRSLDELFATVPTQLRARALDLPPPLTEQELVAEISRLAARNRPLTGYDSFLGAGVYHRYIPAIVTATVGRPEFYTAYTPYQAEASQGTLQTIFEFQSVVCALTGLDAANASLYDGATAAAEAMMLAVAHTGRDRVAVSDGIHPDTLRVLRTYATGREIAVDVVASNDGWPRSEVARAMLDDRHAALLVSQPSFLGTVGDLRSLAEAAHDAGALAVCSIDPIAAAVLVPPGEADVDIAIGDVQPLGIPPSFGGPHAGFMAVREALLRRLPGRLVGLTTDARGGRAYTLTLQTREQHIRRERATSNICTNHALMALAATVHASLLGGDGLRSVATVSAQRAHLLADRLARVPGFSLAHPRSPFLWEFVLRCPEPAETFAHRMRERGIIAGLPLGQPGDDRLLVCCTEMTAESAIDRYVEAARAVIPARVGALS